MKKSFLFGLFAMFLAGFGFGGISLATDYTGSLVSEFGGDPITTAKLILKVGEELDNGTLQGDNILCEGNICEIKANTGKEVQLPEPLLSGKESCTFAGWYSNLDDIRKGGIGDTLKISYTTTLYAKWFCGESGFQVRNQHFDTFEAALASLPRKDYNKIVLLQDANYSMTTDDTYFRVEKNGHNITVTPAEAEGYVMNTPVETNGYVEYKQVKYSDQLIEITKADGAISYSTSLSLLNGDGSTVKLLKDNAVVTSIPNAGSSLWTDADVTLDLNGYTLNLNTTTNRNYAMSVTEGNTLTIKNGTIEIAPTNAKKENGIIVEKGSTLNIGSDVTINAHNGVSAVSVFGNVTLNLSGTLTAENSFVIAGNGSNGNEGYTINIDGGSVIETTNTAAAIYHPNNGTLNISTGTIQGSEALYIKSGETNISGGKFIGKGAKADFSHNGNGANPTGDGVVVEVCDYPGGEPTIKITAGEFESDNADAVASYAQEGYTALTGFIEGGIFSTEPDESYIVEGKKAFPYETKYKVATVRIVTFNPDNGDAVTNVDVEDGTTVDEPENPTNTGNVFFLGWFKNDNKYDFSTPVTETFTLVGKWEALSDSTGTVEDEDFTGVVLVPNEPEITGNAQTNIETAVASSNSTATMEGVVEVVVWADNDENGVVGGGDVELTGKVNFTTARLVRIPVNTTGNVVVKVRHTGQSGFSYDGLTTNSGASCSNGVATTSPYNGELITPAGGYVEIWTCSASTFVAYTETDKPAPSNGSSSGGGGGGGSSTKPTTGNVNTGLLTDTTGPDVANTGAVNTTDDNSSNENFETEDLQKVLDDGYTVEFHKAYEFAFKNGITTMPSIGEADMESPLNRIAMAKMLSYYAINVLGQKPDTSRDAPNFSDVDGKLNSDYGDAVTLAYQLGIMGINMPDNKFRPFDTVTRAEFATALSRMLYGIADGEGLYYEPHLKKLVEEKIITVANPDMQELRGYVMIMLMRSAENE